MLSFLIGFFSFLSGSCLALAVHLHYKDKIAEMKEDWRDALRKDREVFYQDGYKNGAADEKIVQAAQKELTDKLTVIIPAVKVDDITLLIPAIK